MREIFGPSVLNLKTHLDSVDTDNTYLQKIVIVMYEKIAKLEWLLKLVYNKLDLLCVRTSVPPTAPNAGTTTPPTHVIDLDGDKNPEVQLS